MPMFLFFMYLLFLFYSQTYLLGTRRGFNQQLEDTTKKFTYFIPRNEAWAAARIALPSAIKKLFMPDFSYHVRY